jgi:hypothetical protein
MSHCQSVEGQHTCMLAADFKQVYIQALCNTIFIILKILQIQRELQKN